MSNLVVLTAKQIILPHLRNLLACFRLSSLRALLKQAKIMYNTVILALKQGVKVILTLPIVLQNVIERDPHLLRKNPN